MFNPLGPFGSFSLLAGSLVEVCRPRRPRRPGHPRRLLRGVWITAFLLGFVARDMLDPESALRKRILCKKSRGSDDEKNCCDGGEGSKKK